MQFRRKWADRGFYLFASSVRHPFVMYGTLHCKKRRGVPVTKY
jgi:hypothetical protein